MKPEKTDCPPYLLLTPGPLTTSSNVKSVMLQDWCTWDDDYNLDVVEKIRQKIECLASSQEGFSSVLLQGSGSYAVEAAVGSFIAPQNHLLIIENGAYGQRIKEICHYYDQTYTCLSFAENAQPDLKTIEKTLQQYPDITHVISIHCETTSGILNPIQAIFYLAKAYNKITILDAMSSFGGIVLDMATDHIDILISSANKCIQGVPGFAFVIAKKTLFEAQGHARSLSLDLHAQWKTMHNTGKWRFTSPTHSVRAFLQALIELEQEGGITQRAARYKQNQSLLIKGMQVLGFKTLLARELQSPIITTFIYPNEHFHFKEFYQALKSHGFVIYPGKITATACFRIGNIGEVYPEDIQGLLLAIEAITKKQSVVIQKTEAPVDIIAAIKDLFERFGSTHYGENITQLEHALQAAMLAEEKSYNSAMITAALLHDIGHFLHGKNEYIADQGLDSKHEVLATSWLKPHFGPEVTKPIALHVQAKRYLCSTDTDYKNALSLASLQSFRLQGAELTEKECITFKQSPDFQSALQLRALDDAAKQSNCYTPSLDYFLNKYVSAVLLTNLTTI